MNNTPSLTPSLALPEDWSPEQALAVYEVLQDLSELIWARYGLALLEQLQADIGPDDDTTQPDLFDFNDALPF